MGKLAPCFALAGCFLLLWTSAAVISRAQDAMTGANLVNEPYKLTPQQQDEILSAMKGAGVRVVRCGIPNTPSGLDYAQRVYGHGMKIEWLVGVSSPKGNMILSEADPEQFRAYFQPLLNNLESRGIEFAAFELGNEINWSNHDLGTTGRVLSATDLLHDPEGQRLAKGYLNYIKVLAVMKVIRDHSRLNQHTPIMTAGMGELSAGFAAQAKRDAVGLATTLDFMRANGVDKLVDAYGVHWYPPGNATPAQRLAQLQAFVAECSTRKPCWMTEWGLPVTSGENCPVVDDRRFAIFTELRNDFAELVGEGRLKGLIFYTWRGRIDDEDPYSAFLCGAVTKSGRLAVSPLPAQHSPGAVSGSAGIPKALINTGRILPRPAQPFRGWGMSLAWEANDLYGGGRQPAQIKDPKIQGQYIDLLYGNPAVRLTLGFTIARYNIGGGDDPTHTHMRADAQMEGFQSGPGASFDWTRDAPQRKMLQGAKKRGANIFEAASYSPPYWMTVSGCSSGSKEASLDNLRPEMRENFVNYLATVVKHFRDAEGIRFESVEPFNEPDGAWWKAGGRQEGYTVPIATQNAIIPMLASRLKHDGLSTFVAGVDTNNISTAVSTANQLSASALVALGRFNTHEYHHDVGDLARLKEYRTIGQGYHKPIWMSELGCCQAGQNEKDEMWGALFMADSIRMDLRDMGAEAWMLWQPDWEVIAFDPHGGAPQPKKQYYAIGQYSRFIRPGFEIISAGSAYRTLAAYSRASKRVVLVTTNSDSPATNDLDLTAFLGLPVSARVYRTTADAAVNLRQENIALTSNGHVIDLLPARSITTYVIDGVTPLPNVPVATIEGTHQIASQATGLCLNITTNSTSPGAAVIPYPCGAYTNEEFNLVAQADGLYSIHTVNDPVGLCLNISNGTSSPGDGKTPGASGNLIQWSCGDASLPANELFQIETEGTNGYRIRVKSSGLCLEDTGRGGTIRQNRCDPKAKKQVFKLL